MPSSVLLLFRICSAIFGDIGDASLTIFWMDEPRGTEATGG